MKLFFLWRREPLTCVEAYGWWGTDVFTFTSASSLIQVSSRKNPIKYTRAYFADCHPTQKESKLEITSTDFSCQMANCPSRDWEVTGLIPEPHHLLQTVAVASLVTITSPSAPMIHFSMSNLWSLTVLSCRFRLITSSVSRLLLQIKLDSSAIVIAPPIRFGYFNWIWFISICIIYTKREHLHVGENNATGLCVSQLSVITWRPIKYLITSSSFPSLRVLDCIRNFFFF